MKIGLGGFFLALLAFRQIHNENTVQQPDLVRGEAYTRRVVHGLEHAVHLLAQRVIHFCNRLRYRFQNGIGNDDDLVGTGH